MNNEIIQKNKRKNLRVFNSFIGTKKKHNK